MTPLQSFRPSATAVVIGATGGIGAGLVEHLAADPGIAQIHALARTAPVANNPKVLPGIIDVTDETSIAAAASAVKAAGAPQIVIVAGTSRSGVSGSSRT